MNTTKRTKLNETKAQRRKPIIKYCASFLFLHSFHASTSFHYNWMEMNERIKDTTQPLFPSLISCAFPLCFAPFQWTEWKKRTREARKERKTKNKSTENNPPLTAPLSLTRESRGLCLLNYLLRVSAVGGWVSWSPSNTYIPSLTLHQPYRRDTNHNRRY